MVDTQKRRSSSHDANIQNILKSSMFLVGYKFAYAHKLHYLCTSIRKTPQNDYNRATERRKGTYSRP